MATRSKGIAASNKITRKGQTAVSVPRRRTAMPQSTRDVIRHFHYVFKYALAVFVLKMLLLPIISHINFSVKSIFH